MRQAFRTTAPVDGPPPCPWPTTSDTPTLFTTPPALNRWVETIARLLSDMPVAEVVPAPLLFALCDEAKDAFSKELNLLVLEVEKEEELVLVGDVHGQFKDMQTSILSVQYQAKRAGRPDKHFLFLGDYVDRGQRSVEVFLTLAALKMEYPKHVHLIRGNHEEFQTCRIYGFLQECRSKYSDERVWTKFNEVFRELPLAAIVVHPAGQIFCAHGGLSPKLDIVQTIQFLQRDEYGVGLCEDSDIIDGLLWSDPADHHSGFRLNQRGCGFCFGADRTEAFLRENQFDLIVRAHQMSLKGYQYEHNLKLLTLFSAPNYCGISGNLGAIATLNGSSKDLHLEFSIYDVVPEEAPPLISRRCGEEKGDIEPDTDHYVICSYFIDEALEDIDVDLVL